MTQVLAREGLPAWAAPKLQGKTVALAGYNKFERAAARALVEHEGGTVVEDVTATLDLLLVKTKVAGKPSGAEKKAAQLTARGSAIGLLYNGKSNWSGATVRPGAKIGSRVV